MAGSTDKIMLIMAFVSSFFIFVGLITSALFLSSEDKATLVDVRLLFKKAIEISAVAIIICHNHPSGKTEPSSQDKVLTKKIKEAGVSLDIKLLDHLIITEKSYFSFADNGKI